MNQDATNRPQMNALESYYHAGRKAGQARKRHDTGTWTSFCDWFNRAKRLESPAYAAQAQAEFNRGYKAGS